MTKLTLHLFSCTNFFYYIEMLWSLSKENGNKAKKRLCKITFQRGGRVLPLLTSVYAHSAFALHAWPSVATYITRSPNFQPYHCCDATGCKALREPPHKVGAVLQ